MQMISWPSVAGPLCQITKKETLLAALPVNLTALTPTHLNENERGCYFRLSPLEVLCLMEGLSVNNQSILAVVLGVGRENSPCNFNKVKRI